MKQLFFLLAICCNTIFASDNIVVVFDTSGSMADKMSHVDMMKIDVAKNALKEVLTNIPSETNIGLLTFDGWKYSVSPIDSSKLTAAINACAPGGNTPLYKHIIIGADELLKQREKNGNSGYYKLVVVTDGEAQDENLNFSKNLNNGQIQLGCLQDIISRGIVVDTIALDMSQNHSLKKYINGKYMSGDNQESLTNSLKKSVAEIGTPGQDNLSNEIFSELNQMDDTFLFSVLKSLTITENHPIGTIQPSQNNQNNPNIQIDSNVRIDSSIGPLGILMIFLSIVVGSIVICVFVFSIRSY